MDEFFMIPFAVIEDFQNNFFSNFDKYVDISFASIEYEVSPRTIENQHVTIPMES